MISPTGILTIDLAAIQSNWKFVAQTLKPGATCAAVVKANAYSVGAVEVAGALYAAGCRHFYVVTLDEALELQAAIPNDSFIYVLGGVRCGSEEVFRRLQLIPVLYSLPAIEHWIDYCAAVREALPCAVKLDTGMTRLGLSEAEFKCFLATASEAQWLKPVLIMSHLACADELENPLNEQQMSGFKVALEATRKLFPDIKASLANSSGSFLKSDFHFDMVRIGAALYGISPHFDRPNPLRQVISLKLPIQQIRSVEQDVQVGYGATAKVGPGTRLAIVAGGSADGVQRTLGFKPVGFIDGVEVTAVGRISMDSCVFDITASTACNPSYIEVINEILTLDVLMQRNRGLGYEALTSLGKRYRRCYLAGDGL